MTRLYDLCSQIRSKNSGPFKLTCDLFFDSPDAYMAVRQSGLLTRDLIASRFKVPPDQVELIAFLEGPRAIKITLATGLASGDPGTRDIYGAQQAAALYDLEIPKHLGK